MAKTNSYKIATWVLVGVLVLGGIIGFISFGDSGSSNGAIPSFIELSVLAKPDIKFKILGSNYQALWEDDKCVEAHKKVFGVDKSVCAVRGVWGASKEFVYCHCWDYSFYDPPLIAQERDLTK